MLKIFGNVSIMGVRSKFRRHYYAWLNEVFNAKDEKRLKEIGPDRLAAEWIIRNGGQVQFENKAWNSDYTGISSSNSLVSIDGSNISLTSNGLKHLEGLEHLHTLKLTGCRHITSLDHLTHVATTLKYLDLSNCVNIDNISPIKQLTSLETLILTGSLQGSNRQSLIHTLRQTLNTCNFIE